MNENNLEYSCCSIPKNIVIHSLITLIDDYRERDYYFPGEQHNFWEIVYVISGIVGITADNRIYTLSTGDIIFHKPMEFHKLWSCDQTTPHIYILSFKADGDGMQKFENSTFRLSSSEAINLGEIVAIGKSAFCIKGRTLITGIHDFKNAQIYINLLEIFLLKLENKVSVAYNRDKDAKLFSEIMKLLDLNLSSHITISMIAEQCNISPSKLKKIFHHYTGMGLISYHNKMKIKKAIEYLSSEYSIAEISSMLGYTNQFYFSNVFKKETGKSPTEYKALYL